jgi:hypothetical protein
MCLHQLSESVIDQFPAVVRHHRFERHGGHLDREIACTGVPDVDDGAATNSLLPCGEKVARRVG